MFESLHRIGSTIRHAPLQRKPVEIICEVHPLQMRNCASSVEALDAFLAEVGYVSTPLDGPAAGGIFPARIAPRPR